MRISDWSSDVCSSDLDGLIALTGGGEGAVSRLLAEEQAQAASAYLDRLAEMFPDRLYIELCRRGLDIEEKAETALVELAYARDLPLVATNPACFADAVFHKAHDPMLCIAQSQLGRASGRERVCQYG